MAAVLSRVFSSPFQVMAYLFDTSRRSTKGQSQAPPSDDLNQDSNVVKGEYLGFAIRENESQNRLEYKK